MGFQSNRYIQEYPAQSGSCVAEDIHRWLAANLFDHGEFSDIHALLKLKEKRGKTISLCLPALNEEATIGPIVKTMKSYLMDRYPLIDEIVVIDSGSVDGTREAAVKAGAGFYYAQNCLEEFGTLKGKGENLWKSLYLLRGDILVWIDSDITNIHPKFVYGLIGPLLARPDLLFCKAFYQRPLKIGDTLSPSGGGRVTEILMRPLINRFFPKLSGFIQPLSGEYAAKRELLQQIPVFTGYGVEAGLLIDILSRFGLDCMAQVDLDKRIHRNKDLEELGKMAFGILQPFFKRCQELKVMDLAQDMEETLLLLRKDEKGIVISAEKIVEVERPPMIQIEKYRRKFMPYSVLS